MALIVPFVLPASGTKRKRMVQVPAAGAPVAAQVSAGSAVRRMKSRSPAAMDARVTGSSWSTTMSPGARAAAVLLSVTLISGPPALSPFTPGPKLTGFGESEIDWIGVPRSGTVTALVPTVTVKTPVMPWLGMVDPAGGVKVTWTVQLAPGGSWAMPPTQPLPAVGTANGGVADTRIVWVLPVAAAGLAMVNVCDVVKVNATLP
jgi:hypothetical protein